MPGHWIIKYFRVFSPSGRHHRGHSVAPGEFSPVQKHTGMTNLCETLGFVPQPNLHATSMYHHK